MPLWYNEPKDGNKFASVSAITEDTVARCTIEEARIVTTDNEYVICGFITALTDISKAGNKDWRWEPQLATITIHRKAYSKKKKDGDKWVDTTVEAAPMELFLCKVFEENKDLYLNPETAFKGEINFSGTFAKSGLSGKDNKGNDVSPEMLAYFKDMATSCVPCPIEKLADLPSIESKKSNGYGSSKGQTEYERLNDRMKFLKQTLACGDEVKNAWDLSCHIEGFKGQADNPEWSQFDVLMKTLELLTQ